MNRKSFVVWSLLALFGLVAVSLDASQSAACDPTGGPKFDGICADASFGWTGPCREYVNGMPEAFARFNLERGRNGNRDRIIDFVEFRLQVIPMSGLPYERKVVFKRSGSSCTALPADSCMQDWLVKGKNNMAIARASSIDGINANLNDKTGAEFWLYYTWMCTSNPPIAKPDDQVMLRIFYGMIDPTLNPATCDVREAKLPDGFQFVPALPPVCP